MTRRVRILVPSRFPAARRNSDVSYLLNLKIPGYSLTPTSGWLSAIETNARYAGPGLARRAGLEELANSLGRGRRQTRIHVRGSEFRDVVGALSNMYLPRQWPRVPVIFEHDFLASGELPWVEARRAFLRDLDVDSIRKSAALVVRSHASAEAATRALPGYPRDRIKVIPHLMPHIRAEGPRDVDHFLDAEQLRVLFVGHCARVKGLETLATAIMTARQRGAKISLDVYSDFLDGAVSDLPEGTRVFSGQGREQVRQAMLSSHVLALPSSFEAFGMVLAEAAATGCALIYPAFEPQLSFFEGTGWPAPPGDAAALADTLTQWGSDRGGVHAFGLAAQRVWREEFEPGKVTALYQQTFDEVFVAN